MKPPQGEVAHATVDQHLKIRVPVSAGPHALGVAFLKKPSLLAGNDRASRTRRTSTPTGIRGSSRRSTRCRSSARTAPPAPGDTPSRRRIFVSRPAAPDDEERCGEADPDGADAAGLPPAGHRRGPRAGRSRSIAKRAGRGRLRRRHRDGGCRACWSARSSCSASNPIRPGVAPGTPYRVSDLELASRLSFFLWSSIPDDELLDDARSQASCTSRRCSSGRSAGCSPTARSRRARDQLRAQWLHLRNLDSITPDMRLFPDFDDNLRQAFRQETELLLREHPARGPQRARSAARRTTRSSTNGWRSTTASRTSTAAASAASRSTRTASAAACCARAAS